MVVPALPNIRQYTEALTVADASPGKLVIDEKGTICSPNARASQVAQPPLIVVSGKGQDSEILVKRQLSHGGMGVVLLAEQSSLGREVAVKAASPGKDGAELVVEARVAGQLEHPNIVPVHLLGQNVDGKPLIVMKRIEGESWRKLLAERAGLDDANGRKDLARDIDILMDVCRALHFAHAHGVVHRDVKPANVMVGRFGEVYLLDWGVAVGYGDNAPVDVPRPKGIAGTPHYMAPEMTLPGHDVDQRTDIYLVGAVLHEILTGEAPHARDNVDESMFAAHLSEPPDLDGAPEELADICKKAMRRDPSERYQSAEDVRTALARFQSHAASRALCDDAERTLTTLRALPDDADARDVQRLFSECRFGFAHALRGWPESTRAKTGFMQAIEHMATREIRAGHLDSATLLVGELDEPSPDLARALTELRTKRDEDAKNVVELQKFAVEHDVHTSEKERAVVAFACGVGWLVLLLALAELDRRDVFHAAGGTFACVMSAILVGLAASLVMFPAIRKNAASRSLFGIIVVGAIAILMVHAVGFVFNVPAAPILGAGDTILAAMIAVVAVSDKRLWPATSIAALIAPAIVVLPAYAYVVSGVGSFLALSIAAYAWRRGGAP